MKLDSNQQVFFTLVRVGLWADCEEYQVSGSLTSEAAKPSAKFQGPVDWEKIFQWAVEQSVIGVVLAGLEYSYVKPPQELLLQWIGEVQMLEQQNLSMNKFVAQLIEKLRNNDIYALLVKGQGIAQCYEKPLWRASGDIDLLIDANNYEKAKAYCESISDSFSSETSKNIERLHQEYQIGDWIVELHGTMHADLSRRMDHVIDQVQSETFSKNQVRVWKNGDTDVTLPNPGNDVIFVFTHILQHLFFEGIGLRQICDWCRLLWIYKDSINHGLLESRIRSMGVLSEWKVLAVFAVEFLGMPAEVMPLYSEAAKWKRKAGRICSFIMEVGNFGHNREVEWANPFKRRSMLIWHRIIDTIRLSFVFPVDAPKFLLNYACDGMRNVL